LYDYRGVGALWRLVVIAEPLSPNHRPAGRDRGLLVLRCKFKADLALQLFEGLERFQCRV
jgi:hypothetical protein